MNNPQHILQTLDQPELSFDTTTADSGYDRWQEDRRVAKLSLAKRLGLPLGHLVEVWLKDDVRLRGSLELAEEKLFVPEGKDAHLQLRIGHATFEAGEIESCVRTD